MNSNRRKFLSQAVQTSAGIVLLPSLFSSCTGDHGHSHGEENAPEEAASMFFKISLAEWSLHKTLFGGEMTNMDFPSVAKNEFGIDGLEYVNQFFKDKAEDMAYLKELKQRTEDLGVTNLLIMIDGEGQLGATDDAKRQEAVDNHKKWVEAAKFLGCHSIRVNAAGEGTAEEVAAAAVNGLGSLSTFAKDMGMNVIVENHGGYSSDGKWLSGVMAQVAMDNCGTLPDFGNFCIKYGDDGCGESYDRYTGVTELMPYAKGVSAKSHVFDGEGNETNTDYTKMLQIVKDAGYTGYIGIEYEGSELGEKEGIMATKKLLQKVGAAIS